MFFSFVIRFFFLSLLVGFVFFSVQSQLYAQNSQQQEDIHSLIEADLGIEGFKENESYAVFDCRVEGLLTVRVTKMSSGHNIPEDSRPWRQIECYHGEALFSNKDGQLRCVAQRDPLSDKYVPYSEEAGNTEILWQKGPDVLRLSAMCKSPKQSITKARLVYNQEKKRLDKISHVYEQRKQYKDSKKKKDYIVTDSPYEYDAVKNYRDQSEYKREAIGNKQITAKSHHTSCCDDVIHQALPLEYENNDRTLSAYSKKPSIFRRNHKEGSYPQQKNMKNTPIPHFHAPSPYVNTSHSRPNVPLPHPNAPLSHPNVPLSHPNAPLSHPNVPFSHPNVSLPHSNVSSLHLNVLPPYANSYGYQQTYPSPPQMMSAPPLPMPMPMLPQQMSPYPYQIQSPNLQPLYVPPFPPPQPQLHQMLGNTMPFQGNPYGNFYMGNPLSNPLGIPYPSPQMPITQFYMPEIIVKP